MIEFMLRMGFVFLALISDVIISVMLLEGIVRTWRQLRL